MASQHKKGDFLGRYLALVLLALSVTMALQARALRSDEAVQSITPAGFGGTVGGAPLGRAQDRQRRGEKLQPDTALAASSDA